MSERVLHENFRDLLVELQEAGARFLIVGAHAMAVHGVPRATGDLGVLVAPDSECSQRVFQALTRFGAPIASHRLSPADFEREGTVYQMGLPPRRIDLMTSISGVRFEEAERSAVTTEVDGILLPILSRRHLLANKLASGRPKDELDARLLQEIDPEGEPEG